MALDCRHQLTWGWRAKAVDLRSLADEAERHCHFFASAGRHPPYPGKWSDRPLAASAASRTASPRVGWATGLAMAAALSGKTSVGLTSGA